MTQKVFSFEIMSFFSQIYSDLSCYDESSKTIPTDIKTLPFDLVWYGCLQFT